MNNKTKKQLADAISNALLQGRYIIKDDSDNGYFERLGYVVIGSGNVMGREPVLVYVTDNGVEIHWMFDEALNLGDGGMSGFMIGVMHAVEPSMTYTDADSRTMMFAYPDTPEQ